MTISVIFRNFSAVTFIILMLFLTACSEPTPIGAGLIDDETQLNATLVDTFSIKAHTIVSDSVLTAPVSRLVVDGSTGQSFEQVRPYLLGRLNDPTFGQTQSSFYTQVRLPNSNVALGDNLLLDSLVLSFAYVQSNTFVTYGDTLATHDVYIHEVTEQMEAQTLYYNNQTFAYDPLPIGQKLDVVFDRNDSLQLNVLNAPDSIATVVPQLRVRLNDRLGYKLMAQSGTSNFDSNTNFLSFFKGFYVTTTTTKGNSLAYFDMLSNDTRLVLYYKEIQTLVNDDGTTELDTLQRSLNFLINEDCAIINNYRINHVGTEVDEVLQTASPNAQETIYAQSLGGLGFEIDIPHFGELGDSIFINKAVLEFSILPETNDLYDSPLSFSLFAKNLSDNTRDQIATATLDIDEDGNPLDTYQVVFNFYAQNELDGLNENMTEQFFINSQSARASRAIIGGPEHPTHPMKLMVLYTQFD